MAETRLTNVIIPEVFNPYLIEEVNRLDKFIQSGIVEHDSYYDTLAQAGGNMINMPYWTDLTGDSEVLSDSTALTVNAIGSNKDVARLHMRGKAWGVNDLAKALSGDDPMKAIAGKVAKYWLGQRSKVLFETLKGIFASASMSGNVYDISGNVGAEEITASETLNAKQLFGENDELLTAIAMHSAVKTHLQKQGLINNVEDLETGRKYDTYLGYEVIVDDQCEVATGVYSTYLFGMGAVALGNGSAPTPTETDRDSLAGVDVLINRQHFIMHPRGVKWNEASVAGVSPTFTEIATASNWTRVYDNKNVRIVQFKHKLANT